MRRILCAALALLVTGWLAACGKPEENAQRFRLTDVTGANFGKALALTDHNGKPRTLADFRGRVTVVFFGFTHCPDVCPTTLAELAHVATELGPEADRMQVLFVTVDPERDTRELLANYVPAFNPRFLGLTGDADAIAAAAKEFKIYYRKQPLKTGGYTMDHSAGTYILDQQGRLRLFAPYGAGAPTLLHDIRILLAEK